MQPKKQKAGKSQRADFRKWAVAAILLAACFPARTLAQQKGQRMFPSAEEAASALVAALQGTDEKAMLDILGPDGKEIVSSGDEVQDAQNRARFVGRYQQMHRLVREPDGNTTLYIGAENWPTPIPLVSKADSWYFDTDAGKEEILHRRVGRNEMSAIRVCEELAAAQKEYYSAEHNQYAQKIFSDEGHNGLYWKAAEGEPQSPIGPLVAAARAEGYTTSRDSDRRPFRGYFYHILASQGKRAPGGAKSYVVNGRMTGGFAFLAFPAEYRSSGVMTFLVSVDGVVYEKDLGKDTARRAQAMKEYNPGGGWRRVYEPPEETAEKKPK